ncbi:MAG TPA: NAD(P)/FAD-dependent oxidoreductase [Bacteroidales bacterium]|nr:NAD(P)/FAD-dependent oxidoreductase [Bacteroidales bacterium]
MTKTVLLVILVQIFFVHEYHIDYLSGFPTFAKSITMNNYDVIIIGAGASGLLAAIRASELGMKAVVLEKMGSPGRKLLVTGKGRCNITNSSEIKDFIKEIFPDGRFLYPAFKSFFSSDILNLLNECGVNVILERGGRYFPESEQAADIVDALYSRALKNGVKFCFNSTAVSVIYKNDEVSGVESILGKDRFDFMAKNVIVCTGGKSYPGTGSTGDGYKLADQAGHKIEKLFPALVSLVIKEDYGVQMQGLTLKNINAALIVDGKLVAEEFGDLMFAHYGLSGPVILTLSRKAVIALDNKSIVNISIDFKPALDHITLDKRLLRDLNEHGKKKLENVFKLLLPQKAIDIFLKILKIDVEKPANQISGKERKAIVDLLKDFNCTVTGHRGFNEAVITAGGVSLEEVNPKTLESRLKKGLYFAGEVLNLDANTGGYNLQIAFSTGWLAAESAANSKLK